MVRHRWWVIAVWIVIIGVAGMLASNITHGLTSTGFDNPRSSAVWVDNQLVHFTSKPSVQPLLVQGMPPSTVRTWLSGEHLPVSWLHSVGTKAVVIVPSPTQPANRLDGIAAYAKAHGAVTTWVNQTAVGNNVTSDTRTTLASSLPVALPFLIILLLLVFGSITSALLPLVVAGVGVIVALGALDLIENAITLSSYLTDIVSFLALGVGVDYALFISARFRQALSEGKDVVRAAEEAMQRAGRSVMFSGIAVALALGTLFLGGNPYWRGIAIGGAVAVLSVLFVTHTLLPALLRSLGHKINWGRIPWTNALHRFWPTISGWIRRKPYWALILAVLALGIPAVMGRELTMQTPANLAIMLPRDNPLRKAIGIQQRVWGPGTIDPIVVMIRFQHPLTDASEWKTVATVAGRLSRDAHVRSVASATGYGLSPAVLAATVQGKVHTTATTDVISSFTNVRYDSHLVAIFVTAKGGPNQASTIALTSKIQHQLSSWLPEQRTGVGGVTALLSGFNQLTRARLPWILVAVATVALVVLFVATGSFWQALLGVAFDGLVALATAGILVVTIQHGGLGLEAESLDSSITPLVFVLLFGLSMDYEVILLHRIQELWRGGLEMREAATEGLSRTGGMITGAGMIMVVVFIALLLSPLEIMKTLAIGLTSAILLDTWIVRSFLVPGNMVAIGRSAFWPSRRGTRRESES